MWTDGWTGGPLLPVRPLEESQETAAGVGGALEILGMAKEHAGVRWHGGGSDFLRRGDRIRLGSQPPELWVPIVLTAEQQMFRGWDWTCSNVVLQYT